MIAKDRVSAKEQVRQVWHNRRMEHPRPPTTTRRQQQQARRAPAPLTFDVCQLVRNLLRPKPRKSVSQQTFSSVQKILYQNALVHHIDAQPDIHVLSAKENWTTALQQMTAQRSRAFWLVNVAQLFERRQRRKLTLLTRQPWREDDAFLAETAYDVQQAAGPVYATHHERPPAYYRHLVWGKGCRELVSEDPSRLAHLVQRMAKRAPDRSVDHVRYVLRLPEDWRSWSALVEAQEVPLAGVSLDLGTHSGWDDRRRALGQLVDKHGDQWRVDFTGVWSDGIWLDRLEEWWANHSGPVVEVTIDATQWLRPPTVALCTRIIGVKEGGDRMHYYIDDGCYGSLSKDLPAPEPLFASKDRQGSSDDVSLATIWGPTCDGLDKVAEKVRLPKLERDDWLVFAQTAGGHGTQFNGFEPPDVAYCALGYFR